MFLIHSLIQFIGRQPLSFLLLVRTAKFRDMRGLTGSQEV